MYIFGHCRTKHNRTETEFPTMVALASVPRSVLRPVMVLKDVTLNVP